MLLSCNWNDIILHKSEHFCDGFIVELFVHFRKQKLGLQTQFVQQVIMDYWYRGQSPLEAQDVHDTHLSP